MGMWVAKNWDVSRYRSGESISQRLAGHEGRCREDTPMDDPILASQSSCRGRGYGDGDGDGDGILFYLGFPRGCLSSSDR